MTHRAFRVVPLCGLLVLALAGCSKKSGGHDEDLGSGTSDSGTSDLAVLGGGDGGNPGGYTLTPQNAMLVATVGQAAPTQQFQVLLGGQPVSNVVWSFDRGDVGTVSSSGLFSATGTAGGKGDLTAIVGSSTLGTTVTVQVQMTSNGDPAYVSPPVTPGAGGYGGVGGNGPGGPASPAQQQALDTTPTADPTVTLLYPYDKTVWPRGLLAPLLQWTVGTHHFDSASLHIKAGYVDYQATFAANSATSFINLPIPQAAWDLIGLSSGGQDVTVTLVLGQGASAIGPLTETWHIAPGALKGTVFYQAYGTHLVDNWNYTYTDPTTHATQARKLGGATLAITPKALAPVVAAGTASMDQSGCRVCHSVSSNGQRLVTQHGDNYALTSAYDLAPTGTSSNEVVWPANVAYAFPALYPDGSLLLTASGGTAGQPGAASNLLYSLPQGTSVGVNGLVSGFQANYPAFSPDGKHLAFNFWGGTGADKRSLATLDFDLASKTFSGLTTVYTSPNNDAVSWLSYLPTSAGVVFEVEQAPTPGGSTATTAQLWWTDLATKTAHSLDALNGAGYLPSNALHPPGTDELRQTQPTVDPIASGGYAWIIFTSRRMYGNVSTAAPYQSDPRNYDIETLVTPKKLWVAAFDINGQPGTDPSHPAFYLPAQELFAGNSRGYWTTEACQADGQSCETGDECCGGYCRGPAGALTCSSVGGGCAQEYEKCATTADCCTGGDSNGLACINNVCTQGSPIL